MALQSSTMRIVAVAGALAITTPATAGDSTDTGLLAALGVTAASGKTTLGDGAGAIEAALYAGDAFQHAGVIIAQLVEARRNGRPVLLLSKSETVDLLTPVVLANEAKRLTELIGSDCVVPKPKPSKSRTDEEPFQAMLTDNTAAADLVSEPAGPKLKLADIVGAAATDTSIGGLTLTVDDRALINAVLMNAPGRESQWQAWTPGALLPSPPSPAAHPAAFFVPGEIAAMPDQPANGFHARYEALLHAMAKRRVQCAATDRGKAAIAAADAFVTGLNTPDKGPAPLSTAIAADAFASRSPAPLILRLNVEQSGGTSMSRSGLIYTLGFPNAATVGAGLLASFRLIEPRDGSMISLGNVRCAVRQTNVKRVADHLQHRPHRPSITQPRELADTLCDYKVTS